MKYLIPIGLALCIFTVIFSGPSESKIDASKYVLPTKLADIPTDPKNPLTPVKVELGRILFKSKGLSFNPAHPGFEGSFSCETCHLPEKGFTAGQRQGLAQGAAGHFARVPVPGFDASLIDAQPVRTPTAIGMAFANATLTDASLGATAANMAVPVELWAGPRINNQLGLLGPETQAIAGIGAHRLTFCDETATADFCTPLNVALFKATFSADGEAVNQGLTDLQRAGLAIAAYERTLLPTEAPFQRYLKGEKQAMTKRQVRGMGVFFRKEYGCTSCHANAMFGSDETAAIGLGDLEGPGILERHTAGDMRGRGGFNKIATDDDKYRIPQLYNLKEMVPLGHGGTLETVEDAVEYCALGKVENADAKNIDPRHRKKRRMTNLQLEALKDFIKNGLYDPNLKDR